MTKNVGQIDKILRISVGLLLIVLAVTHVIGWWGYIGVVPLLTGLVGNCPAYMLIGVNTCKLGQKSNA